MEPRRSSSSPAPAASPGHHVPELSGGGMSRGMLGTILAVLLIITSVIASAYLITRLVSSGANNSAVKSKQYQALFLTNGQVYFGYLTGINDSYVKLSNIYYLQVQQQVQPGQQSNSQNPSVSLAKLGNELHGPEDTMYVDRSQVLFWENLKDSGKVVQAIKNYQATGKTQ